MVERWKIIDGGNAIEAIVFPLSETLINGPMV